MGPRGDAIVEADWCVGELLTYFEERRTSGKDSDYFFQVTMVRF